MGLGGVRVALMAGGLLLAGAVGAWGQAKTDAEITLEQRQAQTLYEKSNFTDALPLYEDLYKQRPTSNLFRERLAMSLLGQVNTRSDSAQAEAVRKRAKGLLEEAKAAGDDSNLLQVLLEQLNAGPVKKSTSPGADAMERAEKAFSSGKLEDAVALYDEAAKAEPTLYQAPLFAGDAEYKLGNFTKSGEYFQRATAINPDAETAYRYWGDMLMKAGKMAEAEDKFIDSILAQPYQKAPRVGMKQWAEANHVLFVGPPVTLPPHPKVDEKGNINVTLDASTLNQPDSPIWTMYGLGAALWAQSKFKAAFPKEKAYRDSLPEELDTLKQAVTMIASLEKDGKLKEKDLSVTLRTLRDLDKDGMLECFVLLDHPSQGIAQDYIAYRGGHRELMRAYIKKYDLHPAPAKTN